MRPTGIQLVGEFIYCQEDILNNKEALEETVRTGIKKCGLNLRELNSHQFAPIGITVTGILGESHIAIHTYPEARHASLDIFTCSGDSQTHINLLHFLKSKFKPKTIRVIELFRGNPLEITEKDWITSFSIHGFEVRYHIKERILSKKSRYQQIDIIENENFGRMLFLDKDLQIAEKDAHLYNLSLISPLIKKKNSLNKVAILGGGDGGVLYQLLEYNPKKVILIDIDKEVIWAAKRFLQCICKDAFYSPNLEIVIEDANKFLEENYEFDAIIYDLTMHPEAFTRMDRTVFLNQLFFKIKNSLNKKGMVTLQCCSEFDTETLKLLKNILSKHFKDIIFQKCFIPSFCENWIFAHAAVR